MEVPALRHSSSCRRWRARRTAFDREPEIIKRKKNSVLPGDTLQNTVLLRLGEPDATTLVTAELCSAIQATINSPTFYRGLQYGPEEGTADLIKFLVDKINQEQSLSISPANMMLVAGATHAVDMLARLYARQGGVVLIEAPTYVDAIHVFRDHQAELYSIPMDNDGLIPSELKKCLVELKSRGKSPAFLYTIPTFHNPRGSTLSVTRRAEIIELACQYDFLIVEDDVYRDLSFSGNVPPSFYAMAQGKQVCSIGSFSKTLAPGLRLGWLIASEDIIQKCVNCGTTLMGGGASPFSAQIVAEYCRSGYWEKHILHLRSIYKTRRDLMLAALEDSMPSDVTWTHPEGGFFIWLTLPGHVFAHDVTQQMLQKGISVAGGDAFFQNPADGQHNLRLAYSYAAPEDLKRAIGMLAQVIKNCADSADVAR